jgi:hypothetical protein
MGWGHFERLENLLVVEHSMLRSPEKSGIADTDRVVTTDLSDIINILLCHREGFHVGFDTGRCNRLWHDRVSALDTPV